MPIRRTLAQVVEFLWDSDKNEWLKGERRISFEEIALRLSQRKIWKVVKHPNQNKYSHQKVYLVPINGYIWVVPFVESGETIFLKTAFQSRKMTRTYTGERRLNGTD
jgi:hypothetical protein